jgi:hypothetical protein
VSTPTTPITDELLEPRRLSLADVETVLRITKSRIRKPSREQHDLMFGALSDALRIHDATRTPWEIFRRLRLFEAVTRALALERADAAHYGEGGPP